MISCCSVQGSTSSPNAGGRANLLGNASEDATTCPVMGGVVASTSAAEAAGLYRDHEGARYYFCCAGCGPTFDADPARYVDAA